MTNPKAIEAAENTDRELWRETPGDYYSPSIHVTAQGAIGIDCGGTVYVKPVRVWHELARASRALAALSEMEGEKDGGLTGEERAEGRRLLAEAEAAFELGDTPDRVRTAKDLQAWLFFNAKELLSPAPGIDWKRVGETPDYDAGLLNDWGGGNVDWWQDYIRAEVGRANEYWRSIVTAMGGDDGQ